MKLMELIPHCDLFSYPGDCRIITVNTVGVMGAGIAKTFRDTYPDVYWQYKKVCKEGYFHMGVPELVTTEDGLRWLLFPTKAHWRDPSEYRYLEQGLGYLIQNIGEPGYVEPDWHLIFPPLGCGHGRLDFNIVKQILASFDGHIPNPITIIAPPSF